MVGVDPKCKMLKQNIVVGTFVALKVEKVQKQIMLIT